MDENDELLQAVLANVQFERVASYVTRGQRFSHLSVNVLCEEWVKSFKSWSTTFECAGCYDVWNDCESEFDIRGVLAPYEQVERELVLLDRRARNVVKFICGNPARQAEMRRFLVQEGYFLSDGKDVERKALN